jgi:adenine-specific DNA-methyltransferase
MATLNWIGKDAVTNHDKDVPFKLLEKMPGASVGKESKNLIVHGDNLEALKALMPFYKGKVKCIYIDPPYNTGNESWIYNDKVNSPKIREWLGKVVGHEAEDLTRHDKWLCMMYPRLKLLRDLLSDDGLIFVSIDDNEAHRLRLVMEEIFGQDNFLSDFIWNSSTGGGLRSKFVNSAHQYVLLFAKDATALDEFWAPLSEEAKSQYKKEDAHGIYREKDFAWRNPSQNKNQKYLIKMPDGSRAQPKNGYIFRFVKERFEEELKNGTVVFKDAKNSPLVDESGKQSRWNIYIKKYLDTGMGAPISVLPKSVVGLNSEGLSELKELFDTIPFNTPKSTKLLRYLFSFGTQKDSIVLDSFAGSGTTGHAVLDLNKEDGGTRQFILVEMEDNVAKNITAERMKRAIKKNGYDDGFEYCELKKSLFNAEGMINEQCSYDELAAYIYFTETQMNIDKKRVAAPLIGSTADKSYYLLYAGKGKNDLTRAALVKMKIQGKAVIYADRCLVDEQELAASGIVFKQIPYEIIVY